MVSKSAIVVMSSGGGVTSSLTGRSTVIVEVPLARGERLAARHRETAGIVRPAGGGRVAVQRPHHDDLHRTGVRTDGNADAGHGARARGLERDVATTRRLELRGGGDVGPDARRGE